MQLDLLVHGAVLEFRPKYEYDEGAFVERATVCGTGSERLYRSDEGDYIHFDEDEAIRDIIAERNVVIFPPKKQQTYVPMNLREGCIVLFPDPLDIDGMNYHHAMVVLNRYQEMRLVDPITTNPNAPRIRHAHLPVPRW
ncbi:MAG: hypothetical protein IPI29_08430 [Ignavibacteria bacterium]|nr:hypothetical protein [Ignavibacteria bacterium]